MHSTYDKKPSTSFSGSIWQGWKNVREQILETIPVVSNQYIIAVECYQGVNHNEIARELKLLPHKFFIDTTTLFKTEDEIREMTFPDVTDDATFGKLTRLKMADFISEDKLVLIKKEIKDTQGIVVVYGYGASIVAPNADLLLYADMPRWEIQQRMRGHKVNNIGINNYNEETSEQYKRGFFVDWRVCDNLKKNLFSKIGYWLDTTIEDDPKMIDNDTFCRGLDKTASKPFRVVPFFDPGPWGGQWMKEKFELEDGPSNYAWCFDCVPEENSLLFNVSGTLYEMPAVNLVFFRSKELLGEPVEARFGKDFPIRFDFLDTMKGGNLSLQVHPDTQYIHDNFGMKYTQDESYYIMDSLEDAIVYLGIKSEDDKAGMCEELHEAQEGRLYFDADKYVNTYTAKKHDHFLIPAGTIHCSGKNCVVLEISATPFIFTFKLWDWGRMGLDGKPRPINIEHGSKVIKWERNDTFVKEHLINKFTDIVKGDGWNEERTGLHENEFIETRRHWFSTAVIHETGNGVNVLNLVEGEEAIIESPENAFEPFVVHYAETFIIPASVHKYSIRPYGKSVGKKCATIKAYVRFKS